MIDLSEIRKWWNLFVGEGNFTEVRILGKFQYSGYFKSLDNLVKEVTPYSDMDNEQIYFTLNTINPDCYARLQCEKIIKAPKMTTTDTDIIRRRTVMIDFDPVRATGVNASDAEFEKAHTKAQSVFKYLRDKGFADPIICVSGNGYHLQYAVDMPNDNDTAELLKKFLQSLSNMFSDAEVDIDEKVFNAGRICKLYGTTAKKGANIPERPWRMSKIIYAPQDILKTPVERFEEIAALLPPEEPKVQPVRRTYSGTPQFDIRSWLAEHGIVYKEEQQGANTRFTLEYCPWVDTHSDKKKWDSALFMGSDGKLTFNCHHSHCKDKTWHDFRLFYEPDAYSKPIPQPQPYQGNFRQYQQKPKYEIKPETEEKGKKWLGMSNIAKVDLASIPRFKTGITELDRLILGLAECEVTLVSGSNASGKSSWLNTLILNAIEQGVPSALFSGELPAHILKSWIQMPAAGKRNLKPSQFAEGKYYVPDNIGKKIDMWMEDKFFLFNNEYGNNFEELIHDAEELLELGVKLFVWDNLMATDLEHLDGDKNGKQKSAILRIKEFATKNRVHVILVAHPRKSLAFLRKNDISGTADLTNAVDNVLLVHRCNQDFFKAGAEFYGQGEIQRFNGYGNCISIEKNRAFGICDVLVGMHYEIESRRFKNSEFEDIHYGWENIQEQQSYWNEPEHYEVYSEGQPEMPFAEYQGEDAPPF